LGAVRQRVRGSRFPRSLGPGNPGRRMHLRAIHREYLVDLPTQSKWFFPFFSGVREREPLTRTGAPAAFALTQRCAGTSAWLAKKSSTPLDTSWKPIRLEKGSNFGTVSATVLHGLASVRSPLACAAHHWQSSRHPDVTSGTSNSD
jgi:hypothetical protein